MFPMQSFVMLFIPYSCTNSSAMDTSSDRNVYLTIFLVSISVAVVLAGGGNHTGSDWHFDETKEPAGGLIRISGDGPKAELVADPTIDVATNDPITTEQVFTHPNYRFLAPISECGVPGSELDDDDDSIDVNQLHTMEKGILRTKRIVGGKQVKGLRHPWMAHIYLLNFSTNQRLFHCAGTLISNTTVLTAAHCLTRILPGTSLDAVVFGYIDRRKVRFCNTTNFTENCSRDFIREIEDFEVHNDYSEGNLNNDIGVIYLKKPVKISPRVRPVCLPYSYKLMQSWANLKLSAVGWGAMDKYPDQGPNRNSPVLKIVEVDLQPRALCDKFHTRIYGRTDDSKICLGGHPGRGTCNGDSGGGVLKSLIGGVGERVFQLGIVSAGGHGTDTCGFQGRPIIATNVLFHMDWILNHIYHGALSYIYVKNKDPDHIITGMDWDGSWIALNQSSTLNNFSATNKAIFTKKTEVGIAYFNEFSTGKYIDVSQHPNAHLLPSKKHCGHMPKKLTSSVIKESKTARDEQGVSSVITFLAEGSNNKTSGAKEEEGKVVRVKRVVGGVPTSLDNFYPWMAQIYVRNVENNELSLRCSGTIISRRHILTAAHCVTEIVNPFVFDSVIVGQYNRNSSKECIEGVCYMPIKAEVEDVVVHAEYEKFTSKNNIALIRLLQDLKFTRMVQPICLPLREKLTEGINVHNFVTAGWGRVLRDFPGPENRFTLSEILIKVAVDLVPRKDCDFVYSRSVDILDRSRFCGGGKPAKGECTGDGGSPFMKQMDTVKGHILQDKVFQLGIVSFNDCGLQGMPTVYINVLYYMEWILDNLVKR